MAPFKRKLASIFNTVNSYRIFRNPFYFKTYLIHSFIQSAVCGDRIGKNRAALIEWAFLCVLKLVFKSIRKECLGM